MGSKVEENLARKLASNDLPTRNKALKRLKKWMAARSGIENAFTELEFLKLWKGLFVCMWHSDKPLVQEELAGNIASLIDVFHTPDIALDFIDVFFTTMAREWHGIDRLRLDKFYMLIRKVVHQCFNLLHKNGWKQSLVDKFVSLLEAGPLNHDLSKTTLGIQLHVVEVYLPQLLIVVGEREEVVVQCPTSQQLLRPFTQLLANTRDHSVMECVCSNVMEPLLEGETFNLDMDHFSSSLRSLAISRNTVGRNRKTLYNYCKRFSEQGAEASTEVAETTELLAGDLVEEGHSKQSTPHSEDQLPAKKKRRKRNK